MERTLGMAWKAAAAAVAFVCALCLCMVAPVQEAHAAVAQGAKAVATDGAWKVGTSNVYYKVSGKAVTGLVSSGAKTDYFDDSGMQRVGWRKIGSKYYYFAIKTGASGTMLASRVVNGVKLDSKGAAVISNDTVKEELKTMVRAQLLADKLTKVTDSKSTKLRKCFNYLKSSKITEKVLHGWTSASGWHRMFANQIFLKKAGDCYSMGCAMAYLGNAVGYKKAECVSSGGHGWARIDGLVYDPEWSAHRPYDYYAVNGSYREMSYAPNSAYVVNLSRTKVWTGKSTSTASSTKTGLVKKSGAYYYYSSTGKMDKNKWKTIGSKTYYFGKDGKAVVGPKKISGTYYVFTSKAVLAKGSGTHVVKVGGEKYRVTSKGKAKKGWSSDKMNYFQANGKLTTGIALVSGKLNYFSKYGNRNIDKTHDLRVAAADTHDASKLLALMGTPAKVLKADACAPTVCEKGHSHDLCTDGVYTYKNLKIWTTTFDCEGVTYEYLVDIA